MELQLAQPGEGVRDEGARAEDRLVGAVGTVHTRRPRDRGARAWFGFGFGLEFGFEFGFGLANPNPNQVLRAPVPPTMRCRKSAPLPLLRRLAPGWMGECRFSKGMSTWQPGSRCR